MSQIAIIILNWNTTKLTKITINSFLKIHHTGFRYHLVLVDNGSQKECIDELEKTYKNNPEITILKSATNTGYAHGNNIGIEWALSHHFDYIMIANSDIRVAPDFLEILYKQAVSSTSLFLAPKIYFEKGYEFHKERYRKSELGKVIWAMGGKIDWDNIYGSNIAIDEVDQGQYDQQAPSPDFISGCCFLVNSAIFRQIGLFDDKYYLYLEDADFSVRATLQKYQLKIIPQAKIWHINSGSAAPSSHIQDYFITRNRLLFAFKYTSFRTKFALFREAIKFLFIGRYWQKIGVRDFLFSKFEKGSWS
ncbi:MAG: glycosyltransferase family 2 protein [Microgenomates group bacterium]